MYDLNYLKEKRDWVWKQSLILHGRSPDTRIASSLSPLEIFICLYYGKILNYDPQNPQWKERDRFIISKGHGSISMYPILADLGFFDISELEKIGTKGSFLGGIPDPIIPGYETVNGSLGHGLGVSTGMAFYLKRQKSDSKVFVMIGDGELYEGSNWEAIMLAPQLELENLVLIVDFNKVCMLDYCEKVINWDSLTDKFKAFGWNCCEIDGHDIENVHEALSSIKNTQQNRPTVLIANTIKGKGVKELETSSLSHVLSLKQARIEELIGEMQT